MQRRAARALGRRGAARVDVRPYAADDRDLWVASDLTPGLDGAPNRVAPTTSSASARRATSLAQLTVREPVGGRSTSAPAAASRRCTSPPTREQVVATDVNQRALRLTRFNAELNEVADRIDVRDGSFFEPVAGELFDLSPPTRRS